MLANLNNKTRVALTVVAGYYLCHSTTGLDQGESLTNFRVSGVELRFPAPPHYEHNFLDSPSPVVPFP